MNDEMNEWIGNDFKMEGLTRLCESLMVNSGLTVLFLTGHQKKQLFCKYVCHIK